MADISKISPDDGSTILNIKDSNAIHYGDQSKGYVRKNLLKNNASTITISGVTFTVNSDGSITLNGTATANITSFFINSKMALKAGSYWLTGNPSGITGTSYGLRIVNTSYSVNTFFEQGKILTLNQDYSDLRIDIRIPSGQVIDNLTFYPMIRLASIPDSTYEPYLTPNTEIDNKISYVDNTILGAKNIGRNILESKTSYGVAFTHNTDDSIYVNGTETKGSDNNNPIDLSLERLNGIGKITITFEISDFSKTAGTFAVGVYKGDGWLNFTHVANNGIIEIPVDASSNIFQSGSYAMIMPRKNFSGHMNIKYMIRLASDPDDTYSPYTMTNRELTDAVTPEDGTITAYTGVGITLNTTWTNCKKIGNLVIANARFTVGNSDITSGKILTLPYTCVNQGSIEGITRQANGVPVLFNTVANDKNVHLTGRNNLLANTEYILSFVYVTND